MTSLDALLSPIITRQNISSNNHNGQHDVSLISSSQCTQPKIKFDLDEFIMKLNNIPNAIGNIYNLQQCDYQALDIWSKSLLSYYKLTIKLIKDRIESINNTKEISKNSPLTKIIMNYFHILLGIKVDSSQKIQSYINDLNMNNNHQISIIKDFEKLINEKNKIFISQIEAAYKNYQKNKLAHDKVLSKLNELNKILRNYSEGEKIYNITLQAKYQAQINELENKLKIASFTLQNAIDNFRKEKEALIIKLKETMIHFKIFYLQHFEKFVEINTNFVAHLKSLAENAVSKFIVLSNPNNPTINNINDNSYLNFEEILIESMHSQDHQIIMQNSGLTFLQDPFKMDFYGKDITKFQEYQTNIEKYLIKMLEFYENHHLELMHLKQFYEDYVSKCKEMIKNFQIEFQYERLKNNSEKCYIGKLSGLIDGLAEIVDLICTQYEDYENQINIALQKCILPTIKAKNDAYMLLESSIKIAMTEFYNGTDLNNNTLQNHNHHGHGHNKHMVNAYEKILQKNTQNTQYYQPNTNNMTSDGHENKRHRKQSSDINLNQKSLNNYDGRILNNQNTLTYLINEYRREADSQNKNILHCIQKLRSFYKNHHVKVMSIATEFVNHILTDFPKENLMNLIDQIIVYDPNLDFILDVESIFNTTNNNNHISHDISNHNTINNDDSPLNNSLGVYSPMILKEKNNDERRQNVLSKSQPLDIVNKSINDIKYPNIIINHITNNNNNSHFAPINEVDITSKDIEDEPESNKDSNSKVYRIKINYHEKNIKKPNSDIKKTSISSPQIDLVSPGKLKKSTKMISQELRIKLNMHHDEMVLDDFACALIDKILIQGRIYVTTLRIGFHSYFNSQTLFGETIVVIPINDIKNVEKKSGVFGIENTIHIQTIKGTLAFTSFLQRDKAHNLIYSVAINSYNFDINGNKHPNEFYESAIQNPNIMDATPNSGAVSMRMLQDEEPKLLSSIQDIQYQEPNFDYTKLLSERKQRVISSMVPYTEFKVSGFINTISNTTLYKFFEAVFGESTHMIKGIHYNSWWEAYSLKIYPKKKCIISPWSPSPPKSFSPEDILAIGENPLTRTIHGTKPLKNGIPFINSIDYIETQKLYILDDKELNLHISVDILTSLPFSNSFIYKSMYIIKEHPNRDVTMELKYTTEFVKNTIFKSKIISRAVQEAAITEKTMKQTLEEFKEEGKFIVPQEILDRKSTSKLHTNKKSNHASKGSKSSKGKKRSTHPKKSGHARDLAQEQQDLSSRKSRVLSIMPPYSEYKTVGFINYVQNTNLYKFFQTVLGENSAIINGKHYNAWWEYFMLLVYTKKPVQMSKWEPNLPKSFQSKDLIAFGDKPLIRKVIGLKPLKGIPFLSSFDYEETQKLYIIDNKEMVLHSDVKILSTVPLMDTFIFKSIYVMKEGLNGEVSMEQRYTMEFIKSTIFKSKIMKSTLEEIDDTGKTVKKALEDFKKEGKFDLDVDMMGKVEQDEGNNESDSEGEDGNEDEGNELNSPKSNNKIIDYNPNEDSRHRGGYRASLENNLNNPAAFIPGNYTINHNNNNNNNNKKPIIEHNDITAKLNIDRKSTNNSTGSEDKTAQRLNGRLIQFSILIIVICYLIYTIQYR